MNNPKTLARLFGGGGGGALVHFQHNVIIIEYIGEDFMAWNLWLIPFA
jgi:hypothetical protein